jgi:hypothetical protein
VLLLNSVYCCQVATLLLLRLLKEEGLVCWAELQVLAILAVPISSAGLDLFAAALEVVEALTDLHVAAAAAAAVAGCLMLL